MLKPLSSLERSSLRRLTQAARDAYPGSPAETYVTETRHLATGAAETHQLGYIPEGPGGIEGFEGYERFAGMLAIPNLNYDGHVVGVKFRKINDDQPGPKYDGPPATLRLFNLRALRRVTDAVVLCEGELEAVTWTSLGVPAVAIPGASNWKPHHRLLFEGIPRVVMVYDDDETYVADGKGGGKFRRPGLDLAKKVVKDLQQNDATGVVTATAPGDHKDANSALAAGLGRELVGIVEAAGREESATDVRVEA